MNFPSSTYRVQLNSKYPFKELKKIIEYLDKLGISTIYAAPITTAIHDSSHGYDVSDPNQINPEIGTLSELKDLSIQLKELNMTWLQDIVPNHMTFASTNHWLMDVMERREYSPYHKSFDINWNHPDPAIKGKIMVPILGNSMDQCIESGEIKLGWTDQGFYVSYFDNQFPLSISAITILISNLQKDIAASILLEKAKIFVKQAGILYLDEWQMFKKSFILSLWTDKQRRLQINQCIEKINADKKLLKRLLESQFYLLAPWQVSEKEMDYRRFFTVNSLICLRMEDEAVFNSYHELIHSLCKEGLIQGVRIDHIDGLYHPQQYVARLRKLMGDDCYIIAEKILEYNEDLARDWNLQGTSGYEFLSFTNRLLTDKEGCEKILSFYKALVPETKPYQDIVYEKKFSFLHSQMGGELDNLMTLLKELKLTDNANLEEESIKKALGILMSSFPVYRIYPDRFPINEEGMQLVNKAFEQAILKAGAFTKELAFLRSLFEEGEDKTMANNKMKFIMRLMQFTSPLAAKGVEDTTFYVYNPLISHNEVGDSPNQLAITIEDFHQKMISRQRNNPYSLNATSTHDTKRGEDARMRINVLPELADEWHELIIMWQNMNECYIKQVKGRNAPSVNDTHFIYQSLIGSFPEDLKVTDTFMDRTKEFIIKALREAKVETTYANPNIQYEEACVDFIHSILKKDHYFLDSFLPFLQKVISKASVYSLVQSVLKITAPGIPDIYQGSELWELSYVDPDNRRPVDFEFRIKMLDEIIEKSKVSPEAVLSYVKEKRNQGAEKLFVTWKTLSLRRDLNDLFLKGEYVPFIIPNGEEKVIAYARFFINDWIIVVLPVGIAKTNTTGNSYKNLTLQLLHPLPSQWRDIFTNKIIDGKNNILSIDELFSAFPIAVLRSFNSHSKYI
jgi:(1->4)-alpha-D-glucan 1-alpha-D-glucosylmutase